MTGGWYIVVNILIFLAIIRLLRVIGEETYSEYRISWGLGMAHMAIVLGVWIWLKGEGERFDWNKIGQWIIEDIVRGGMEVLSYLPLVGSSIILLVVAVFLLPWSARTAKKIYLQVNAERIVTEARERAEIQSEKVTERANDEVFQMIETAKRKASEIISKAERSDAVREVEKAKETAKKMIKEAQAEAKNIRLDADEWLESAKIRNAEAAEFQEKVKMDYEEVILGQEEAYLELEKQRKELELTEKRARQAEGELSVYKKRLADNQYYAEKLKDKIKKLEKQI